MRILTGTDVLKAGCLNNPTVPDGIRAVSRSYTSIGSFSVLYTNSIIFPGVCVGEGAVASAGAVVNKDLEPWVVYSGWPLVPVRRRDPEDVLATAKRVCNIDRSSG